MVVDDSSSEDDRQRIRDQIELIARAHEGRVAWDSEDPADFSYLYDPDHLLMEPATVRDFEAVLERRDDLFAGTGRRVKDPIPGLARYRLPERRQGRPLHEVLDILDADEAFDADRVRPDHWLHVAPGDTKICPAIEPEETGLAGPWPPRAGDKSRGKGVRVSVVDSGWHPPAAKHKRTPWLSGVTGDDENNGDPLREYAGHGTFIAGVVKCLAPAAKVRVEGFLIGGGAILESEMVTQLRQTLRNRRRRTPQLINLSAGACTRKDRPLLSFEVFWNEDLSQRKDCILVAAAGNDASPAPFWPASFAWAVGVGSLDRGGEVSSFSNYGDSADVYALGRNLVNAYPNGTYVCRETPEKGDVRVFDTGMARWSGTSFSAPVVVGLIAARMSSANEDAATACTAVLAQAGTARLRDGSTVKALRPPYG
jgi:subtilisin family serine protease